VPPGTGSDALVRDDFGRLLLCRFGERSARSPAPQRSLIRNKSNQSINLEFMRMQLDPVAAVAVATVGSRHGEARCYGVKTHVIVTFINSW